MDARAGIDFAQQQIDKLCLVIVRVARRRSAGLHGIAERVHLVNGWPAIESHDKFLDQRGQFFSRLGGSGGGQMIDPQRDHDSLPVAADQRKCSVEVEYDRAKRTLGMGVANKLNR